MANTLVVGNDGGGDIQGIGDLSGAVHSLVGPNGHQLSDYLNGGLADHGGPTRTIALANKVANLALKAGDGTTCATAPVSGIDQRGVTRPSNCDVGAFELESVAPTTSTPRTGFATGVQLTSGGTRGTVTWTAGDPGGSGVVRYAVARSVNGGAWTTLSGSLTQPRMSVTLASGRTYQFRVRAVDRDGNTGAWVKGPVVTGRLVQQTSRAVAFKGTWAGTTSASFSGGSARRSSSAGASATFAFTGRAVALVSTLGTNRGRVSIFVNGAWDQTVDLGRPGLTYRAQVWSKSWATSGSRTIKVVVVGTPGRPRVDADAFAVLR